MAINAIVGAQTEVVRRVKKPMILHQNSPKSQYSELALIEVLTAKGKTTVQKMRLLAFKLKINLEKKFKNESF